MWVGLGGIWREVRILSRAGSVATCLVDGVPVELPWSKLCASPPKKERNLVERRVKDVEVAAVTAPRFFRRRG